jgi:hypothetical protein
MLNHTQMIAFVEIWFLINIEQHWLRLLSERPFITIYILIYIRILLSTLPCQGFSVTGYIRADRGWRGRLWAYKWRFKQPLLLVHTSLMICPLTYVPNPPCQLSLWEETGVPGENPRLSVERWLLLFSHEDWVRVTLRSSHWGLNQLPL